MTCPKCGRDDPCCGFGPNLKKRGGKCRQCANKQNVEECRRLKRQVIAAYGGKCQCCGESEFHFLSIDHKKSGGRKHKYYGRSLYRWLRRNGWPKKLVRLLWHHCNHGRFLNGGRCPHQRKV